MVLKGPANESSLQPSFKKKEPAGLVRMVGSFGSWPQTALRAVRGSGRIIPGDDLARGSVIATESQDIGPLKKEDPDFLSEVGAIIPGDVLIPSEARHQDIGQ